jgi:hypothetical protein
MLRFSIRGPEGPSILAILTNLAIALRQPVVSPEGRTVAFTARTSGEPVLYVRRLDSFDLSDVPGGGLAFFSPDGASLGFFRDAEIWSLELADPVPARVGSLPEGAWDIVSAVWHPDGRVLATGARGLWTLPRDGGEPTLLVAADSTGRERFGEIGVLPDGRIHEPVGRAITLTDRADGRVGRSIPRVEGKWRAPARTRVGGVGREREPCARARHLPVAARFSRWRPGRDRRRQG